MYKIVDYKESGADAVRKMQFKPQQGKHWSQ